MTLDTLKNLIIEKRISDDTFDTLVLSVGDFLLLEQDLGDSIQHIQVESEKTKERFQGIVLTKFGKYVYVLAATGVINKSPEVYYGKHVLVNAGDYISKLENV